MLIITKKPYKTVANQKNIMVKILHFYSKKIQKKDSS